MNIKTWTSISGIACFFTFWACTPVLAQVPAPQLWKARALQAADNLEVLQKKLDSVRDNWSSPQANVMKCEAMLETAFALHVAHESIVHKVLRNGKHAFKIVPNGGENGLFDLTYMYAPGTWELSSVEFFSLPKAWKLFHPAGEGRKMGAVILLVQDDADADPRCIFGFSLENPFFARIAR